MRNARICAAFFACAGCSAILGFDEGHLRVECAPGSLGCGGDSGAPVCEGGKCGPNEGGPFDGARPDAEAGIDSGPTGPVVLGRFKSTIGDGHSIVVLAGSVYITHDNVIESFPTTPSVPVPRGIVFYDSVTADLRPRSLVQSQPTHLAWTSGDTGIVDCAAGTATCTTPMTYAGAEGGPRGLSQGGFAGDLYWVETASSTIRRRIFSGGGLSTVTTLDTTSAFAVTLPTSKNALFVMIGGVPYSVYQDFATTPTFVKLVTSSPPSPSTVAMVAAGNRVVWTRALSEGGGLMQCRRESDEANPCNPAYIAPFTAVGFDVTALAGAFGTFAWAQRKDPTPTSDVFVCAPPNASDGPLFPAGCTASIGVATGLAGKVSAMTIEVKADKPAFVYFVESEGIDGGQVVKRIAIP